MPFVNNQGSPNSRIWVVGDAPLPRDEIKGYVFSAGLGWIYQQMFKDAGVMDVFYTVRRPQTDAPKAYAIVENALNQYQPPLIVALDNVGQHLCPSEMQIRGQAKSYKTQLNKYVGSLLESPLLKHRHYIMPLHGPEKVNRDWKERNIITYFDMQKLREELNFFKQHNTIQPRPHRNLYFKDMELEEVFMHFDKFQGSEYLSTDIETSYPKAGSLYLPHPGYPITIGIANSPSYGISFDLFRKSLTETRELWRRLDKLLHEHRIIGQNFLLFDWAYFTSLGFNILKENVSDTLIRHQYLWPELSHKLQFMTRQYTREPYYKDEGHHWSIKKMDNLRRYNCLDVCVTYEVWLEQQCELKMKGLV